MPKDAMGEPARFTHDPRAAIAEMVRRIVARFDPEKIVLFGSYARGEATAESDVDLLVVRPVEGSRREKAVQVENAMTGIRMPTDIVVITPAQASAETARAGSIVGLALREGKVLYERRVA
ncbi:MAG: nucleotidyltransferase domain-containing protein [Candidatus Methylomirabilis sp.]|nr:nucleotidyltransferase domain-containing protein [Deltaproteobacteria bacterium]